MTSPFSRLLAATVTLGALALPAAAQAAPPYYPSGPQRDVARQAVADAGWTVCYQDSWYGGAPLADIQASCDEDFLMLASGLVGSADYELLAAAPRADVLHDAGNYNSDGSILSNGSQWYYSDSWSWGFAMGGDAINRSSCDYDAGPQFATHADLRMCWHTWGGTLGDGYRAGNNYDVYANSDRVVLQHTGSEATGAPNPLDFGTQAQDTVSAVKTVDWTIDGTEYTPLGNLEIAGPDADDFWLVSDTCFFGYVPMGGKGTCSAKVRFIPSAQGPRSATLRFAQETNSAVALQGVGGPLPTGPQGPAGTDGANGTDGTNGIDGTNGTDGTDGTDGKDGTNGINGSNGSNGKDGVNGAAGKDGAPGANGKDGADGKDGAKGDRGPRGVAVKFAKRNKTRVGCKSTARGAGSRIVCEFNRRAGRNWLVQLRDRRGALSTAPGNGKTTMVFLSRRKPRGAMHAFVIEGLRTR